MENIPIRMVSKVASMLLVVFTAACGNFLETREHNQAMRGALDSTVQLFTHRDSGEERAGSGVVLAIDDTTHNSLILTTAHLLEPLVDQKIYALSQLRRKQLKASIVHVNSSSDLALISVAGLNVRPVSLKQKASLGEAVWVVAFPWGRERTVVSGAVSQIVWPNVSMLRAPPITGPVRLIDASVSYGASGGGVFSQRRGRLLGIVRGYRTAHLSFPGAATGSVNLPVAGETTVINTNTILCFVKEEPTQKRSLLPSFARLRTPGC